MRVVHGCAVCACLLWGTSVAADPPKVVTDIAPVYGIVAQLMTGVGDPTVMTPRGVSPHSAALRPSQARALDNADLVVWIGPAMTPWLERPIEALAADSTQITLMEVPGTRLLDTRTDALFEQDGHDNGHDHGGSDHDDDHDKHDDGHDNHAHDHGDTDGHGKGEHAHDEHDDEHAHDDDHGHKDHHGHDDKHDHGGDEHDKHDDGHDNHAHDKDDGHGDEHAHDHGAIDPHVWLDPANAQLWTMVILNALVTADPDNAALYRANAQAAKDRIEAATEAASQLMEPALDRRFVMVHDAYQYFENAFGLKVMGALSVTDATRPSPARLARLRAGMAHMQVACIFAQPQFGTHLAQSLAEGTAVPVATLDPLGAALPLDSAFYPNLIRTMAQAVATCS